MRIKRILRHLFTFSRVTRKHFPRPVLDAIERSISELERVHAGEIRFAIETSLAPRALWQALTPRDRALHVFADLGVWDTENNNGVLIYLLIADRRVEIVADRGIASCVAEATWASVCREMEAHFRQHDFGAGATAGVRRVGELLAEHFPHTGGDPNELPDRPVLL